MQRTVFLFYFLFFLFRTHKQLQYRDYIYNSLQVTLSFTKKKEKEEERQSPQKNIYSLYINN